MRNGASQSPKQRRTLTASRWELGHSDYLTDFSSRMAQGWLHSLAYLLHLHIADPSRALTLPIAKQFCCICSNWPVCDVVHDSALWKEVNTLKESSGGCRVSEHGAGWQLGHSANQQGSEARRYRTLDLILHRIFFKRIWGCLGGTVG